MTKGTWNPILTFSGSAPASVTYTIRKADYHVNGSFGMCRIDLQTTTDFTGASGDLQLIGFPLPLGQGTNSPGTFKGECILSGSGYTTGVSVMAEFDVTTGIITFFKIPSGPNMDSSDFHPASFTFNIDLQIPFIVEFDPDVT